MKHGMTIRAQVAKATIKTALGATVVAVVSLNFLAAPATAQGETQSTGMTKVEVVSAEETSSGGILTLDDGQALQLPAEAFKKWQEKKSANKPAANTLNTADIAVTAGYAEKLQVSTAGYAKKPQVSTTGYTEKLQISTAGYDEEYGNCGMSWINYRAIGNRNAALSTGFGVAGQAIAYGWYVGVYDNAGYHEQSWYNGNYTGGSSWSGYRTLINMAQRYSWAQVNSGSWAMLSDGSICASGSPSGSTTIY